jgi:hypothetical protein
MGETNFYIPRLARLVVYRHIDADLDLKARGAERVHVIPSDLSEIVPLTVSVTVCSPLPAMRSIASTPLILESTMADTSPSPLATSDSVSLPDSPSMSPKALSISSMRSVPALPRKTPGLEARYATGFYRRKCRKPLTKQ